jgi:hypothetical protein
VKEGAGDLVRPDQGGGKVAELIDASRLLMG